MHRGHTDKLVPAWLMGAALVSLLVITAAIAVAISAPAPSRVYAAVVADGQSAASVATSRAAEVPRLMLPESAPTVSTALMVRPLVRRAVPVPHVAARPAAHRTAARRRPAVRKHAARKAAAVRVGGGGWRSASVSTFGIGDGLVGHGLAGGGVLHADSMVVANRTLPFGTRVAFKYHGRTGIAVVMDRGPYVSGREFDLGPGIAHALGLSGVGKVKYKVLGR